MLSGLPEVKIGMGRLSRVTNAADKVNTLSDAQIIEVSIEPQKSGWMAL